MDNPTVVFKKPKEVVIEDRIKPQLGDGEVLIKTKCTLISTGTELTVLSGDFPKNSSWAEYGKYPFVPGYSNIGVVVEVGNGVDKSWLGVRVANYGSHSAYVKLPVVSAFPVPENISDEQAVFFTIAQIVMNGVRRSGLTWGESTAIYGLGLLGQLTVQFSALCGARPIFGIDLSYDRLKLLPHRPSIVLINSKDEDVLDKVRSLTKGRMVDVVFEVIGDPNFIPKEFLILKRQGRFVVLSSPRGDKTPFNFHDLCNSPSYTIIGAHVTSHPVYETAYNPWTRKRHAELFFELIADKEITVDNLISHRKHFSEAPNLYKMLMTDRTKAMGVILYWE